VSLSDLVQQLGSTVKDHFGVAAFYTPSGQQGFDLVVRYIEDFEVYDDEGILNMKTDVVGIDPTDYNQVKRGDQIKIGDKVYDVGTLIEKHGGLNRYSVK